MEGNKAIFLEIVTSLFLIISGFYVWWWSQQLIWIQIYPPPLAKQLLDIIPFICWGLGILIILDAIRRSKSN
jgi:hypothetical protein